MFYFWKRIMVLFACLWFLTSTWSALIAQSENNLLHQARAAYKIKDYFAATAAFRQTSGSHSLNKEDLLAAGISSFQANDLEFSSKCFEQLEKKSDDKELLFLRAQIFQQLNEFDQAQLYYKKYLQKISKQHKDVSFCKNELLRCKAGKLIKRKPAMAFVVPLSTAINTREDEYSIFPDKAQNGIYFLSANRTGNAGGKRNELGFVDEKNGFYYSDVFKLTEQREEWTQLPRLQAGWNSSMHDAVVGFINNSAIILQYRTDQKCNYIVDPFHDEELHLKYPEFIGPLYPEIGDHSLALFQDSIMIFASCRMGGYGGYDLYLSILRDSIWTTAINLGPNINGPFNEVDPFLSNDGQTLYFSSDNLNAIGGFDIFKTKFHPEAEQWEKPINLGIPVNSAGDDKKFILSTDGLTGFFSSNRKSNSQGGFDLFKAFFHEELDEQLQVPSGSPLTILVDIALNDQNALFGKSDRILKITKEPEWKELIAESIYYKDQELFSDPKNQKVGSQLLEWMKIYPGLTVTLFGHAYEESPTSINLYFSIQKANELKNYLELNGIQKTRIKVFGLGASFPKAKVLINGKPSMLSEKFNKRIEYSITVPDQLPIQINYVKPQIPTPLIPEQEFNFSNLRKGITYSIFLGKSQSVLNHPYMKNLNAQFFVEQDSDQTVYYYYLGIYKNFDEVDAANSNLAGSVAEKPEIYVFKDGIKLSRTQIIDHVVENADLVRYLNYLNGLKK